MFRSDLHGEGIQWIANLIIMDAMLIDFRRSFEQLKSLRSQFHNMTGMMCEVFHNMMAHMSDGLFVVDREAAIVGLDHKAAHMLQMDPADCVGQCLHAYLHGPENRNAGNVKPGLRTARLQTPDGQCYEAEAYTCACALPVDALPMVLGRVRIDNVDSRRQLYLCAVRIVQADLALEINAPGPSGPSGIATEPTDQSGSIKQVEVPYDSSWDAASAVSISKGAPRQAGEDIDMSVGRPFDEASSSSRPVRVCQYCAAPSTFWGRAASEVSGYTFRSYNYGAAVDLSRTAPNLQSLIALDDDEALEVLRNWHPSIFDDLYEDFLEKDELYPVWKDSLKDVARRRALDDVKDAVVQCQLVGMRVADTHGSRISSPWNLVIQFAVPVKMVIFRGMQAWRVTSFVADGQTSEISCDVNIVRQLYAAMELRIHKESRRCV